jgi:hypothetical protein
MAPSRLTIIVASCVTLASSMAFAGDGPGQAEGQLSRWERFKVWAAPVRVIQTDKNLSKVHYGLKDGRRVIKAVETQRADGTKLTVIKGALLGNGQRFPTVAVTRVNPDGSGQSRFVARGLPQLDSEKQLTGQKYRRLTPGKARVGAFFSSPVTVGAVLAVPATAATLGTGGAALFTASVAAGVAMNYGDTKVRPSEKTIAP